MSLDDEMIAAFREEAAAALDELLRLRDGLPALDAESADRRMLEVFRIFHNLKGAARLSGLEAIEPLAHAAEAHIEALRASGRRPTDALLDALGRAIATMLRHAEGSAGADVVKRLGAELETEHGHDDAGVPSPTHGPSEDARRAEHAASEPTESADAAGHGASDTVRVRVAHLDRLMTVTGELLVDQARQEARLAKLEAVVDALREVSGTLLGADRRGLNASIGELDTIVEQDRSGLQRSGHLRVELADTVKSVRMLPLAGFVAGWRRTVEDTANELGKRVRFQADVGNIALDRRILEGIRDPMMHLLRNAVDHGIEAPDVRAQAGKKPVGSIDLRARAVGSMVELEIRDDGRGIDVRAVLARAASAGLISTDRARDASRADALELVFAPGLSTAAKTTHLSGRGIGLDVARARLHELGGRIDLELPSEGGTLFRLALPASLVSTKGLLVAVGETAYALPIVHVESTMRVPLERVQDVEGGTAIEQQDRDPLRLRWLAALMEEPRSEPSEQLPVVVVEHRTARLGLVVDKVLGETEFVVRPLPWNIRRASGVSGAAVLGDGSLTVVLDVPGLMALGGKDDRAEHAAPRASAARTRRVLVADDSVTSRILQRNILTAAGYEVLVAVDGEEAWEMLSRNKVDLLIVDVEMPRLDGLGLTRRIRKDTRLRELPIIVVTSLARPEDVEAGSQAGADEYIVKGRFDHRVLLEAVARLA